MFNNNNMLVTMNLLILSKYLKKVFIYCQTWNYLFNSSNSKKESLHFTGWSLVICLVVQKKTQLQNIQFAIMLDQKKIVGFKGGEINYK